MRIAIDATVATKQLGGISEYTRNLLVALGELPTDHEYYLLRFGANKGALQTLPDLPDHFHDIHKQLPQKFLNFTWRHLNWPKVTNWLPAHDLFFAPHFLVPAGNFSKLVITVHDVLFLDHAEWFLPGDVTYFTERLKQAIRQANRVITISQASKDSLLRHRLTDEAKIRVIPNGVDLLPASLEEIARVRQMYALPQEYLLYIGTIEPRKNIIRQLHAYARLRKRGLTLPFVLAGRRGWIGQDLEETIRTLDLEHSVRLLGDFARDDKAGLLGGARAFLFPSLAEGFGIPVLEAMAAGVPVVTSNTSSLPEVAGDAALLVDPTKDQAIADAVEQILHDTKLANDLATRGRERAAQFKWKATAQATLEVFAEAAV